ncbi:MAG TPA: translation initiation factor IF-2 N-terminal domain-containing protein [Blastocatellia bacterium]|nr:translation initiation factor IF-2 N-terminal domain-containing protein [Blastocatellia bacterium]
MKCNPAIRIGQIKMEGVAGIGGCSDGSGTSRKIRIYELARELKLEPRRVIEEAQRLGLDVSMPSNTLTEEQAEQIRSRRFARRSEGAIHVGA